MASTRPTPRASPGSASARAPGCRRPRCAGSGRPISNSPEQQKDWRAAPILADLKGVAPAHLIVGSLDPLLDDSHNLAAKLKAAGVPCELTVYQGINHGFIRYGRLIGTARAIADCAAALKAGLSLTETLPPGLSGPGSGVRLIRDRAAHHAAVHNATAIAGVTS